MSNPIVSVKDISPSKRKNPSILAAAVVSISWGADTVSINDIRILRGKEGEPWCALPSFSLPSGREWKYFQTVVLSKPLQERVSDAVLAAYAEWSKKPGAVLNAHGLEMSNEDVPW